MLMLQYMSKQLFANNLTILTKKVVLCQGTLFPWLQVAKSSHPYTHEAEPWKACAGLLIYILSVIQSTSQAEQLVSSTINTDINNSITINEY